MRNLLRRYLVIAAAACLAANVATSWAQTSQAAGQFIAVVGEVNIVGADGQRRAAARGAEFREGETIVTGSAALVQLRTADGALISVRGDTEIKLDKFAYSGKDDPKPSFVMSVVKGGFRTITGLIARIHRPGYEIRTASATIGVRGTDFEVVHVPPQAALPEAPAGTYNRVHDGVTDLRNIAGQSVLVSGEQTAFVALRGNVPPVLVAPPAVLFGRPTPLPRATPDARREDKRQPSAGTRQAAPALTPIDRSSTIQLAPTLTLTPIDTTTTTLQPATSTILQPTTTTIQTSPTLTPIDTTTTTLQPSTTTILQPTTTTTTTTTILQPTTTTTTILQPTTTTTTTTIQPTTTTIQTAPTTTLQTAPTTIQTAPTTTIRR